MDRRAFVTGMGAVLAAPLGAEAQQRGKVYRIGVLIPGKPELESVIWTDLRGQLGEHGWVEGRNLSVEWRYAEGNYERLPALAGELVRLAPDLIIARGGPSATAAKRATATIPIVIYGAIDPVAIGVVESLARPGGNVTGMSSDQGPEIMGKRLQLLKRLRPSSLRWRASRGIPCLSQDQQLRKRPGGPCQVARAGISMVAPPARNRRSREGVYRHHPRELRRPGCSLRAGHLDLPAADPRIRDTPPVAGGVLAPGVCARWRFDGIQRGRAGCIAASGDLRRQDSEGRQTRRPALKATHEVRARHQPQDRQGPRPHDPTLAAGAGGSSN